MQLATEMKLPEIPTDRPEFDQDPQGLTYRAFRRTVWQGWDCIMVPWSGMTLGIELDGYTHT